MRSLWFLIALFLVAAPLAVAADSEQKQPAQPKKIVYPSELQSDDYTLLPVKVPTNSQQEYVEISAPDYPGLQFEVTNPLTQRTKNPYKYAPYQINDSKYNSQGGMILSYWGIRFPSGQLVSVPIPVEKPKKTESQDH